MDEILTPQIRSETEMFLKIRKIWWDRNCNEKTSHRLEEEEFSYEKQLLNLSTYIFFKNEEKVVGYSLGSAGRVATFPREFGVRLGELL